MTHSMVDGAPADPGVYALWENGELIYSRATANIRSALLEHLSGAAGPCTRQATHYTWEIALDPAAREAELLREYRAAHQRLPRCNNYKG